MIPQKVQHSNLVRNKKIIKGCVIAFFVMLFLGVVIFAFISLNGHFKNAFLIQEVARFKFAILAIITVMTCVIASILLYKRYETASAKATVLSGGLLCFFYAGMSAISEFIKWPVESINSEELDFLLVRSGDSFGIFVGMFCAIATIVFFYVANKKHLSKMIGLIPLFFVFVIVRLCNKAESLDYISALALYIGFIGLIQMLISIIPNENIINKIFYVTKGIIFMMISLAVVVISIASIVVPIEKFSQFSSEHLGIVYENGMQIISLLICVPAIILFCISIRYIKGKNLWGEKSEQREKEERKRKLEAEQRELERYMYSDLPAYKEAFEEETNRLRGTNSNASSSSSGEYSDYGCTHPFNNGET